MSHQKGLLPCHSYGFSVPGEYDEAMEDLSRIAEQIGKSRSKFILEIILDYLAKNRPEIKIKKDCGSNLSLRIWMVEGE